VLVPVIDNQEGDDYMTHEEVMKLVYVNRQWLTDLVETRPR